MAKDRLYELDGKKGHWYTDEQGNRYFVAQGQTPKEGWEATKRRKMIKGGKYVKDDGDDKGEQEISANEYETYEADEEEQFDETTDADFEDDEPEDFDKDDVEFDEIESMRDEGVDINDRDQVIGFYMDAYGADQKEAERMADDFMADNGTNGRNPSDEATPAYDVGGFYSINEGDRWEYEDGGFVEVHNVAGENVEVTTPSGTEWVTKDELSDMVKNAMKVPGKGKSKTGEPKPKKTVGEDLQGMYEREFFKQANGNKEDFVNHFIDRFGVPRGSSRKREAEFYGRRFDELSASQGQSEGQGPQTANIDANVDEIAKEVASKFGEANVKVNEDGHILLKDPNGFDPVAIADEDEIPAGAIVKIMPNWREPNENPDDTYFVKEDRGDRLLLWSPSKSSSFGGYTYEWPKNTMYIPPRMRGGNSETSGDSVRIPDKKSSGSKGNSRNEEGSENTINDAFNYLKKLYDNPETRVSAIKKTVEKFPNATNYEIGRVMEKLIEYSKGKK